MPSLKRPQLPEGPKKELNAALHDLHFQAGLPSVRRLVDLVGGEDVAGRSRIHDAFTKGRVPDWGLVQILVEAMVKTIPGADPTHEERRLHQLWLGASGYPAPDQQPQQLAPQMGEPPEAPWGDYPDPRHPVLGMRVEWVNPTALDVDTRRSLRAWVDKALDDIGWPSSGDHRRNDSTGSTIVLDDLKERPALTAGTFLAALDSEVAYLRNRIVYDSQLPHLRFLASFDAAAIGTEGIIHDLNALWADNLDGLWRQSAGHISALLHRIDAREDSLQGIWRHCIAKVDFEHSGRESLVRFFARRDDPWASPF